MFRDRVDAGRQLGSRLSSLRDEDVVVLGVPRGGVPVAAEVARELAVPLDVIIVRKLGVPSHPEVAMGAIGEGGVRVLDENLIRLARVDARALAKVEGRETETLARRVALFRGGRPVPDLHARTVVIVDDGLATGATAQAACQVARANGAARVILAVPVGAGDAIRQFSHADQVVCLVTPPRFSAVGNHYLDFSQTGDAEVVALLERAGDR